MKKEIFPQKILHLLKVKYSFIKIMYAHFFQFLIFVFFFYYLYDLSKTTVVVNTTIVVDSI